MSPSSRTDEMDGVRVDNAHEAMFFATAEELVDVAGPYLTAGLEAGDAVGIACRDANADLLHEAFGPTSLRLLPHSEVYRSAHTAVAAYQRFAQEQLAHGARTVRLVGEADFPAGAGWQEWVRFEAVADEVLPMYPVRSVCLYDSRRLPADVLAAAHMTHLSTRVGRSVLPNHDYLSAAAVLAGAELDAGDPFLARPPALEIADVFHVGPLRNTVRTLVTRLSTIPGDMLEDFVLAVHEVVGNGLLHGSRPVSVRLWVTGERVTCSVTDAGTGFIDSETPSAGTGPDGPAGLTLVRALVDEVHAYRIPNGFTVTLSVANPARGPRRGGV
jgi:anti-sigma regulatory factor (Ser/Thr protein kinase)